MFTDLLSSSLIIKVSSFLYSISVFLSLFSAEGLAGRLQRYIQEEGYEVCTEESGYVVVIVALVSG